MRFGMFDIGFFIDIRYIDIVSLLIYDTDMVNPH